MVALHEPGEPALRDVRDADQRPGLEVDVRHEANAFSAAPTQPEGMCEGEAGERSPVVVCLLRCREATEVDVECGLVVERLDDAAAASRDEHRLAHAVPAMADADADGRVGADGSGDDRVVEDLVAVHLRCADHLQVVTRASPDQRHGRAEDAVRAAHDLLLVTGQPVGEQEEHAVGGPTPAPDGKRRRWRRLRAGPRSSPWLPRSRPGSRVRPRPSPPRSGRPDRSRRSPPPWCTRSAVPRR